MGGDIDIEFAGQQWIGLACGASAKSGAVNDKLRFIRGKGCLDTMQIGQIEATAGETANNPVWRMNRCQPEEMASNQPICASYPSYFAGHIWLVEKTD